MGKRNSVAAGAAKVALANPTEVSGNGLVELDRAALQVRLDAVLALASRQHLFGFADATRMKGIEDRLKQRLNPEPVTNILKDADAALALYVFGKDQPPYWLSPAIIESLHEAGL